jgi:hypothetical protein
MFRSSVLADERMEDKLSRTTFWTHWGGNIVGRSPDERRGREHREVVS